MVRRPTGGRRDNTLKTQLAQIKFINEDINDTHRIAIRYVVVK